MDAIINRFSQTGPDFRQVSTDFIKPPRSCDTLAQNAEQNISIGQKTCPIVRECKDIQEGIAQEDLRKATLNSGLLALYVVPIGSAASNAEVRIGLKSNVNNMRVVNQVATQSSVGHFIKSPTVGTLNALNNPGKASQPILGLAQQENEGQEAPSGTQDKFQVVNMDDDGSYQPTDVEEQDDREDKHADEFDDMLSDDHPQSSDHDQHQQDKEEERDDAENGQIGDSEAEERDDEDEHQDEVNDDGDEDLIEQKEDEQEGNDSVEEEKELHQEESDKDDTKEPEKQEGEALVTDVEDGAELGDQQAKEDEVKDQNDTNANTEDKESDSKYERKDKEKDDLIDFMDSKMAQQGIKRNKVDKAKKQSVEQAQRKSDDDSTPPQETKPMDEELKLKLQEIKEVTIQHNVPSLYQDDMSSQIHDNGQERLQQALDNHKKGGIVYTKEEYMLIQRATIFEQIQRQKDQRYSYSSYTFEDPISEANICLEDAKKLKEININDLKVGEVQENTILWTKTIAPPSQIGSVFLILEDKNQDVRPICLYRMVNTLMRYDDLQEIFPHDLEIGIKQPYMQVSYGGILQLRSDHPQNIVVRTGSSQELKNLSEFLMEASNSKEAEYKDEEIAQTELDEELKSIHDSLDKEPFDQVPVYYQGFSQQAQEIVNKCNEIQWLFTSKLAMQILNLGFIREYKELKDKDVDKVPNNFTSSQHYYDVWHRQLQYEVYSKILAKGVKMQSRKKKHFYNFFQGYCKLDENYNLRLYINEQCPDLYEQRDQQTIYDRMLMDALNYYDLYILSKKPLGYVSNDHKYEGPFLIQNIKRNLSKERIALFLLKNLIKEGCMFAFVTRRPSHRGVVQNYVDLEISMDNKKYFFQQPPKHMFCYYFDNYLSVFRELQAIKNAQNINLKKVLLQPSTHYLLTKRDADEALISYRQNVMEDWYEKNKEHFNLGQGRALMDLAKLPENSIQLIQSPPYTGKNHLIIGMVSMLLSYHACAKILICSPSNQDLDKIVETISTEGLIGEYQYGHEIDFNKDFHKLLRFRAQDYEGLSSIKKHYSDFVVNYTLYWRQYHKYLANKNRKDVFEYFLDNYKPKTGSNKAWYMHQQSIVRQASIIGCTLNMAGSPQLKSLLGDVDYLIIDRACQSKEIETIIPFGFCPKHVILIGDQMQLRPASISQAIVRNFSEIGHNRSLFERLLDDGYKKSMLQTQYKMCPSIRKFPSDNFYGGKLFDDPRVFKPKFKGLFMKRVVFFDLDYSIEKLDRQTLSKYNTTEMNITDALCQYIVEQTKSQARIGVMTTHLAQLIKLRTKLNSKYRPKFKKIPTDKRSQGKNQSGKINWTYENMIEVCTVDAFQEKEKDVIIMNCVRSNDKSQIGPLRDIRRINTFMTSAKEYLIILGSSRTLNNDPTWRQLIDYVKIDGLYVFLTKEEVFHICVNVQNLKQLLEEKYYTLNVVNDELMDLQQVKKAEAEAQAEKVSVPDNNDSEDADEQVAHRSDSQGQEDKTNDQEEDVEEQNEEENPEEVSETAALEGAVQSAEVHDISVLQSSTPDGVDESKKEQHLSEEQFEKHFGMSRDSFYSLKPWIQEEMKKKLDLL